MIDLHLKIFKLTIDLHIKCDCKKHKTSKKECTVAEEHEEMPIDVPPNLSDVEEVKDEYVAPTTIELQALKFAEELNQSSFLYDIPNATDIPPRHQITDDVEIITDKFEKEFEDVIEGRR